MTQMCGCSDILRQKLVGEACRMPDDSHIWECDYTAPSRRGVEQSGQLVGLITRRSQVQILPPLRKRRHPGSARVSSRPQVMFGEAIGRDQFRHVSGVSTQKRA